MPNVFTLTLNPALDLHQFVADPQLGTLNRAERSFYSASGKGINVSRALSRQGLSSTAILPLGGLFGSMMQALLGRGAAYFIPDVVPIGGETRCNLKVNAIATGSLTEFNDASPTLSKDELVACERALLGQVEEGDYAVLSGSLPSGVASTFYADLITALKTRGVNTLLDTSGDALEHGASAQPTLVKPNKAEAEALLERTLTTYADALDGARELHGGGVDHVLLTLGSKGAVFVTKDGEAIALAPPIKPESTNGCGDALLGSYLYGQLEGWTLEERARHCVATATARATMTRPRFPDPKIIEPFLEQVKLVAEQEVAQEKL